MRAACPRGGLSSHRNRRRTAHPNASILPQCLTSRDLLRLVDRIVGSGFFRNGLLPWHYSRIRNHVWDVDRLCTGLVSMDHVRPPCSYKQDCLITSVRYVVSNDCISYRMPEDDLAGSSCHFEKRFPDDFLTRADSWKTYATSSWRALKNFVSSKLSDSSDRTN